MWKGRSFSRSSYPALVQLTVGIACFDDYNTTDKHFLRIDEEFGPGIINAKGKQLRLARRDKERLNKKLVRERERERERASEREGHHERKEGMRETEVILQPSRSNALNPKP